MDLICSYSSLLWWKLRTLSVHFYNICLQAMNLSVYTVLNVPHKFCYVVFPLYSKILFNFLFNFVFDPQVISKCVILFLNKDFFPDIFHC